jgi:tetratricopeptide (TPR) repeat protein
MLNSVLSIIGFKICFIKDFVKIILPFFLPFFLFGQYSGSKNIDNLKNSLKNSKDESTKIDLQFKIAGRYLYENRDSAIYYINRLDRLIDKTSIHKKRLELLKLKQILFDYDIPSSKKGLEAFKKTYINQCTRNEYLEYKYLESMYYASENDNIGLSICNTILSKFGQLDLIIIADFYTLQSNLLTKNSRHSESITSLEKALDIYRKLNAKENVSRIYFYLSYEYMEIQDYDKAYVTINKAINVDLKKQEKSK